MIVKAPSFFISRCPEILALQEDLQADYLGSQLALYPAQLNPSSPPRCGRLGLRVVGVEPIYPSNPHSIMFFNPNKDVYESPCCEAQLSIRWD